ncbi:hypothetical protein Nepgr_031511 [Nepenthes gracilis]|uniref:Protein LOW PSII ACCUMULATION 2, chloroplastic n=1 Tax=Nepenthes gracilis TaxID=150966 RepID=A0AAD3Y577_NEPGR|nr:hypothetical protein Nepgr_031511 [Nepenthes gracilis]
MALPLHSSGFVNKPHGLRGASFVCLSTQPRVTKSSEDSSQESKSAVNNDPIIEPKKSISLGQGFGSSQPSKSTSRPSISSKKQRGRKERGSIIRRSPVDKAIFLDGTNEKQAEEQGRNESAFLLSWLGLGAIILVQGIALAASGFLPEEWDNFFVKYVYPSFTPTVFVFVAGTVAYGVFKYLQNEDLKNQK